eukprot:3586636-Pyramimonas_sp.AAC.1
MMRVQQLYCFALLKFQEWRSGAIQECQDATVRLTRGVGNPRTMFWHASGPSTSCLPKRQFPHW